MDYLNNLNTQQEDAVTSESKATLVLAGPGSGKTRVLTHRIAYLIGMRGVRPKNILAVTFTNKAAREMEERVEALVGEHARLTLGTFHGVCVRILRREAERLPFDRNFVIYDSDDQLRVVKRALRDLNLDEKNNQPYKIHGSISRAKNNLILPENYPLETPRDDTVKVVYKRYQELLLASNAVDFDDLLMWTVFLFEQHPEVRERYARGYEHVLVDEFQDTNMTQYQLLQLLSSNNGNIFVVGDPDQSIYRWRGADYHNIEKFKEDFPDAEQILLEQNYRSTQIILDAAMAVIDQNPNRTRKKLKSNRDTIERKVSMHEAYNDHDEARFVVDTIISKIARDLLKPRDFAVMYRTNVQSRLLEEAFLRAGIDHKVVGAQRFYGRREVKDVIAYLRLLHNPSDEVSLMRVINTPPRRIGKKTLELLRKQAFTMGKSMGEMALDLARGEASQYADAFPGRSIQPLQAFGELYTGWRFMRDDLTPLQLMDRILLDAEYHDYINDGSVEGLGRWDNIEELRRLSADFDDKGLLPFLEKVALVSDQDTLDDKKAKVEVGLKKDRGGKVTLLTLHAAKGLEYPYVFIVGLEHGTLPHQRSFDDPEGMAEERRLLYVGMTRAKDNLYLVSALNRTAYGYTEPTKPSRFLASIPEELLDGVNHGRRKRKAQRLDKLSRWDTKFQAGSPKKAAKVEKKYSAGMRVKHAVWSEGMVLNSRVQDGDEILDIYFQEVGLKRVAASLANLEIISKI